MQGGERSSILRQAFTKRSMKTYTCTSTRVEIRGVRRFVALTVEASEASLPTQAVPTLSAQGRMRQWRRMNARDVRDLWMSVKCDAVAAANVALKNRQESPFSLIAARSICPTRRLPLGKPVEVSASTSG